jgi:hypothetical protein
MYLKMTLDNSKKSRKRLKKHLSDPMVDFTMSLMGEVGSDVGSDGWPGIMALKSKSSDAVSQFKASSPLLLFDELTDTDCRTLSTK